MLHFFQLKKNHFSFIFLFFLIIIYIFLYILQYLKNIQINTYLIQIFIKKKLDYITNFILDSEEFNESLKNKYLIEQNIFCKNPIVEPKIEKSIKKGKVHFDNVTFELYIYIKNCILSNSIAYKGYYEYYETKSILSSLSYYSTKKNISKNETFILDIGANIGWYSIILAKNGYSIMSFEASKINYYILRKNFCLYKDMNIIIINLGLDSEKKNCILYHPLRNIGNAYIFPDTYKFNKSDYIQENIKLTKLKYYIPFLKNKNLALIKLDIEGSEGNAIEGGIDLIVEYHIPFILLEFSPRLLKLKGTDPKIFLEMFENNGYKISKKDFLSREYCSINELLKENQKNIYIVYVKFFE